MAKTPAEKIFDKYNPASDVVRAPHGRAKVRPMLDDYARAAVNLYGIISRDELVDIFNSQQVEQTTAAEVYILLLPNVLKDTWYAFYKDYIVHYSIMGDEEWIGHLERAQQGKPRYIPDEPELLRYRNGHYEDSDHWYNWRQVFFRHFGFKAYKVANEIQEHLIGNLEIRAAMEILERHGLYIYKEEDMQEFVEALVEAMNNSRSWENKGYTPTELYNQHMESKRDQPPEIYQPPKPKANQLCVCGSGKKYKLCCGLVASQGTAQLSQSDHRLFFETWFPLMIYVNQAEGLFDLDEEAASSSDDEAMLIALRQALWRKPSLIADYLASEPDISGESVRLLQSWLHNHISGRFVVIGYTPEHALFHRMGDHPDGKLYGVKGVSAPVASAVSQPLPVFVEAVLLPFKDVIIFDTYMGSYEIGVSSRLQPLFETMRTEAEANTEVTTRL